jgi:spore germination protein (amino acid permease)
LEKGITNRQMFFIMVLIITSFRTTDIPQMAAQTIGRSGWIIIIAYAVPFSLVAIMLAKLQMMYAGMTIVEYGQVLLGKVLNYIMCSLFVVYFFTVLVYLNHSLVTLISANFLPKTDPAFYLAAAIALFGFIVYKGTETMARLFELMGVMYIAVTLLLCILMITQSEIVNILPFYNPNEVMHFTDAIVLFGSTYGGLENLFLVPFGKKNKTAPRVAFFCIWAICLLFILVTEGSIGMLGVNNTIVYRDAFIEAVKLAYAPVIERPDILYITIGLASLFAGLIILIHSVVELILKIFTLAKRGIPVTAVCVATYGATMYLLNSPALFESLKKALPMIVLFFAGGMPGILFLLAVIKKRSQAGR